jgi:hypothetical protein
MDYITPIQREAASLTFVSCHYTYTEVKKVWVYGYVRKPRNRCRISVLK